MSEKPTCYFLVTGLGWVCTFVLKEAAPYQHILKPVTVSVLQLKSQDKGTRRLLVSMETPMVMFVDGDTAGITPTVSLLPHLMCKYGDFTHSGMCSLGAVAANNHQLSGLRQQEFFSLLQFWRPEAKASVGPCSHPRLRGNSLSYLFQILVVASVPAVTPLGCLPGPERFSSVHLKSPSAFLM